MCEAAQIPWAADSCTELNDLRVVVYVSASPRLLRGSVKHRAGCLSAVLLTGSSVVTAFADLRPYCQTWQAQPAKNLPKFRNVGRPMTPPGRKLRPLLPSPPSMTLKF